LTAEAGGLDGLLGRLEDLIGRLADPSAPVERLVADYEEATRVVGAAEVQLAAAAERVASMDDCTT
jgi:hypothetical protein